MADVSKIDINGTSYNIKDTVARASIESIDTLSVNYVTESETIAFTNSKAS